MKSNRKPTSAIVFCYPSFHPVVGGIEVVISELAARLIGDFNVYVITRRAKREWPKSEVIAGVRVLRYETGIPDVLPSRLVYPITAVRIIRLARAIYREAGPIVFTFFDPFPQQVYAAAILRHGTAVRVVCSLGGKGTEYASPKMKRLAAWCCDSIVGWSSYMLRVFGIPHPDVHVCYPIGRQPDDFVDRTARWDSKQVLAVCRVHPKKNLETLIKVARKMPDLSFVVAGDTTLHRSYYESLLAVIDKYQVHNVTFLGHVDRPALGKLYSESMVFFLPSKHEQFGLVFAEAMSYGLPVVAPNHTAIPEVVGAGGILYPPGDLDGCIRAIQELVDSRDRWLDLSSVAKAIMAQRYAEDYIGKYARILLAVVGMGEDDTRTLLCSPRSSHG